MDMGSGASTQGSNSNLCHSITIQLEEDSAQQLARLRDLPGNDCCADCKCPTAEWASINFGAMLCIECAGLHRALGVHCSFVRSVTMDSWTPAQLRAMRAGGNAALRRAFEQAGMPPQLICLDAGQSSGGGAGDPLSVSQTDAVEALVTARRAARAHALRCKYNSACARAYSDWLATITGKDKGPVSAAMASLPDAAAGTAQAPTPNYLAAAASSLALVAGPALPPFEQPVLPRETICSVYIPRVLWFLPMVAVTAAGGGGEGEEGGLGAVFGPDAFTVRLHGHRVVEQKYAQYGVSLCCGHYCAKPAASSAPAVPAETEGHADADRLDFSVYALPASGGADVGGSTAPPEQEDVWRWTVWRRYSEFEAMHALCTDLGNAGVRAAAALPSLPPKGLWRNLDEAHLSERRSALEAVLFAVLKRGELLRAPGLKAFLGIDEARLDALAWRQQQQQQQHQQQKDGEHGGRQAREEFA